MFSLGFGKLGVAVVAGAFSLTAANLTVTVLDPSGAVVPQAALLLAHQDSGARQEAVTGAEGEHTFTGLPAGRYELEVRKAGFMLYRQRSAVAQATANLRLFTPLRLGAVMESLEVLGSGVAPAAAQPPRRVRVGGSVDPPKMLRQARPPYPESAKSRGAQGTVLLAGVIQRDGTLGKLAVLASPDAELEKAALEAVGQWRYQPARLNGQAVEVETTVSVAFQGER